MLDKTYRNEIRRRFLTEALPEPLTRASSHIQIFDNYIAGTRMRIRSLRDPATKVWTWSLEHRLHTDIPGITKVGELHLSEPEHTVFEHLEGNEIRKNRYFHEFDHHAFSFDLHLGPLWGLNIANVEFADEESLRAYEPPPFAVYEITADPFFYGENLVGKSFEDVRAEVSRIAESGFLAEFPDE
ncbi:MAG: hypothetical protein IPM25_17375 [Chloracidobacterium sp.]|nr:hypothetical protein [Chloracidobacterium sp.]